MKRSELCELTELASWWLWGCDTYWTHKERRCCRRAKLLHFLCSDRLHWGKEDEKCSCQWAEAGGERGRGRDYSFFCGTIVEHEPISQYYIVIFIPFAFTVIPCSSCHAFTVNPHQIITSMHLIHTDKQPWIDLEWRSLIWNNKSITTGEDIHFEDVNFTFFFLIVQLKTFILFWQQYF